ncbi:efflux RND transporter periplasmic adaptor subunit [Motilimonas pumila]|uniref:Efflux RND transporter periplasmic adaptor subunit n=1 Tax=Motilimonas pumila TaxID=2303987 RepID=A0A418YEI1_9GAMM|nr:efflux RND transporter periplasmic adaptor subunit [Motilimonas pumila]RJG47482.1 efflux RND transporter periplasmic adaptor subunit [Motilimonas pumila]
MKTFAVTAVALTVGVAIGVAVTSSGVIFGLSEQTATASQSSHEPLYWVAPMDPNYQRDKPGKSPMGMDLIPVYADDLNGSNDAAGTITISAAVENNLGVKTASAAMAPLMPRIETVGYVAFDESRLWQTNVRVAGWVEQLNINAVGEQVKQGEVLFSLYSPELVKAQEELISAYTTQRRGMINGAKERLVTLGVDNKQIQQILQRGKATRTIAIKAPADGVIASLNIRQGGYLSPAQAVISAGPLEQVWVDAEVFERQFHWLKPGTQASMTLDAIPGGEWQGEVDYVYPILDPATRTLRVRLKFANPNGELKPNMFANVALLPSSSEQVLTIPRNAVIRTGQMARVVLAQGAGKFRSARIEVGREAGDKIEVLAGLVEGDKVVTSAHFMLDSESSQSADLSRINGVDAAPETVWAKGEVTAVLAPKQMLTIHHQPVPEWDWPGMVMDFSVAPQIDLADFAPGQGLEFEMQKTDSGQYQLVDYKLVKSDTATEIWLTGEITMLMADFGMITIAHQAAPQWQWQAGEMNFTTDEAVPLAQFSEGQKVRFLVAKQGAEYLLQQLEAAEDKQ